MKKTIERRIIALTMVFVLALGTVAVQANTITTAGGEGSFGGGATIFMPTIHVTLPLNMDFFLDPLEIFGGYQLADFGIEGFYEFDIINRSDVNVLVDVAFTPVVADDVTFVGFEDPILTNTDATDDELAILLGVLIPSAVTVTAPTATEGLIIGRTFGAAAAASANNHYFESVTEDIELEFLLAPPARVDVGGGLELIPAGPDAVPVPDGVASFSLHAEMNPLGAWVADNPTATPPVVGTRIGITAVVSLTVLSADAAADPLVANPEAGAHALVNFTS